MPDPLPPPDDPVPPEDPMLPEPDPMPDPLPPLDPFPGVVWLGSGILPDPPKVDSPPVLGVSVWPYGSTPILPDDS